MTNEAVLLPPVAHMITYVYIHTTHMCTYTHKCTYTQHTSAHTHAHTHTECGREGRNDIYRASSTFWG